MTIAAITHTDRSACDAKRHGDESAYTWARCRCPDAREAWRLYTKRIREGRHAPRWVDATGTARRIQALVVDGYDFTHLGEMAGRGRGWVRNLVFVRSPRVHVDTAATVKELFDRLANQPGPSKRARTLAARYGWVPALAWDDIDDPGEHPDCGEPAGAADDVDIVAVWQVLDGHAPISTLRTPAEQTALWLHWMRYRDEYGLDGPGLMDFARRYGVEEKEAQRMRTAAVGRPTRNTKTTTAASRGRSAERSAA